MTVNEPAAQQVFLYSAGLFAYCVWFHIKLGLHRLDCNYCCSGICSSSALTCRRTTAAERCAVAMHHKLSSQTSSEVGDVGQQSVTWTVRFQPSRSATRRLCQGVADATGFTSQLYYWNVVFLPVLLTVYTPIGIDVSIFMLPQVSLMSVSKSFFISQFKRIVLVLFWETRRGAALFHFQRSRVTTSCDRSFLPFIQTFVHL